LYSSYPRKGSNSNRVSAVLVAAIAVLAAGCSSGDDAAAPSSVPPSSSEAPTTPGTSPAPTLSDAAFIPITSDPEVDSHGMPVPPDCEGGEIVLDSSIDGSAVVVREDPDGEYLCVEAEGAPPMPISVQTGMPPVDTPTFETSGIFPPRIVYQVRLPAGFAADFTVQEAGTPLMFARARNIDYLLVIESIEGPPDPSSFVPRAMQLVAPDGTELAVVSFYGPGEPQATYEDFAACVRGTGLDFPQPPQPNSSQPPPRVDAPIEDFEAAWAACKEVFFSSFFASQPPPLPPEFVANFRFEQECVAEAGLYPFLMQVMDDNAFLLATGDCNLRSPSVIALVECLRVNGLDVMVDGSPKPGPWPLDVLGPAWQACRDAYAISEYGNPSTISMVMPRSDCFAENGYVNALVVPASFGDATLLVLSNGGRCN
jgi:hypothetical protein